jgi:hypothetical protein
MPTAWAAPVLSGKISESDQMVSVWPDPDGKVQGAAVHPLYRSVPQAAQRDPALYDLLALVDARRIRPDPRTQSGGKRERASSKDPCHRLIFLPCVDQAEAKAETSLVAGTAALPADF